MKNIINLGNLKFAENYEENLVKLNNKLGNQFKKKKIWVASSTHEPEEIFCAKAHLELRNKYKNLLTIIIPRHVHRIEKIFSILKDFGFKVQIKNENDSIDNTADIVLVNYYGAVLKY